MSALTSHLHDVPRDDVPSLDPLHRLSVSPIDLPHLRFIFFQRLDGVLCVPFLRRRTDKSRVRKRVLEQQEAGLGTCRKGEGHTDGGRGMGIQAEQGIKDIGL